MKIEKGKKYQKVTLFLSADEAEIIANDLAKLPAPEELTAKFADLLEDIMSAD